MSSKRNGQTSAKEAVTFARDKIFEREAVADERMILRDALRRGMGETTYRDTRAEFDQRRESRRFQLRSWNQAQLRSQLHHT